MKRIKNILYVINIIYVFITTFLGGLFMRLIIEDGLIVGDYYSVICYICSVLTCNRLFYIFKKLVQKENKDG